jgi:hypothetical protein
MYIDVGAQAQMILCVARASQCPVRHVYLNAPRAASDLGSTAPNRPAPLFWRTNALEHLGFLIHLQEPCDESIGIKTRR